jgi:hypothetical protein
MCYGLQFIVYAIIMQKEICILCIILQKHLQPKGSHLGATVTQSLILICVKLLSHGNSVITSLVIVSNMDVTAVKIR